MIAATRITRGPHRVIRRLARKLLKPLLLRVNRLEFQASEVMVLDLQIERAEVDRCIAAEHRRQVRLSIRHRELEAW